ESCPYYNALTIPAGTYPGQDEDVETITVEATLIVSANVDSDTVYDLTAAIFDHTEDITIENAKGAELNLETASSVSDVPYHEGAARYYREHGIEVNTKE
nr:TAXI family TRAP transporter solute-binding subunit [Butyrivibrio sp.]